MSTEDSKAVARRYWEETELGGVVGEELFSPNHRFYVPGSPGPLGRKGYEHFSSMFYSAFPDARFTVEDMIAEGDRVVSRYTIHGTNLGTFQGLPPTRKQLTIGGITIFRVADGRIAEQWSQFDTLSRLQQLGVVTPSGQ